MRSESRVCMLVALLLMSLAAVTANQQPAPSRVERAQCHLPANVSMRSDLAQVLCRIYDRSPTFRAQCRRIAEAGNVRITIRIDTAIPTRCRAFTIVTRRGYDIRAEVHLPPSSSLTELAAHEFEHVLEQIEGMNLRALSRKKDSGVREVEGGAFETVRAQAAGRVAAAEAERASSAPAAN